MALAIYSKIKFALLIKYTISAILNNSFSSGIHGRWSSAQVFVGIAELLRTRSIEVFWGARQGSNRHRDVCYLMFRGSDW